jgi:flagellar export protein FliJ
MSGKPTNQTHAFGCAKRSRKTPTTACRPAKEPPAPSDHRAVTGPSFRFRLERVRALRERREDLAREALAHAIHARSDSQQQLSTIEAHLEHARGLQRQASAPAATVSAAELAAQQAFVERIETQRLAGARELARHDDIVADRGAQLGEAAREHEMLERLKERHRVEHVRTLQRVEGNTLDEIAMDRFRRSAA